MELMYHSTRHNSPAVTASEAVLKGLAEDGGLYVPASIPDLGIALSDLPGMSYQELAYEVMSKFLTDYTEEELKDCIAKAYDEKFDRPDIAPLVQAGNLFYLELFHGPTIAFKDMALSILPHLLTTALKKHQVQNEVVILTATSGDTGKAALSGFADVPGTRIIVFYPKEGVSKIQELQMCTQKGDNTFVVGIHGNFDQAQTGVKAMFESQDLGKELQEKGYQFSSANSINIGRLVPQIVYYAYAYAQLLKRGDLQAGESVQFVVPTGNFGNILAGYYAKEMGLPIETLVCASNENQVLYDFFQTGTYDKKREFFVTTSPSMDILISSNLERLLYRLSGDDGKATNCLMEALKETGKYEISEEMKKRWSGFLAGVGTEAEGAEAIRQVFEETGYLIDPHTAVAASVALQSSAEDSPCIVVSTASPYKFAKSVMCALDDKYSNQEEISLIEELYRVSKVPIPEAVSEVLEAEICHDRVCKPEEMEAVVKEFLGL